jgi:hypothetical protein
VNLVAAVVFPVLNAESRAVFLHDFRDGIVVALFALMVVSGDSGFALFFHFD